MVNTTRAASPAGRHEATGRHRKRRNHLLAATVLLVAAAPIGARGDWALASSGGSTTDGTTAACQTEPGGATSPADAVILVTLCWNNNNDEDLHVVEPDGTEIAYYSPGVTRTGGLLDRDDEVFMCHTEDGTDGRENVTWAAWTNPDPGAYQVRIVEFNPCDDAGPAPARWALDVHIEGRLVHSETGTTPGTTPRATVAEFTFEYAPGEHRRDQQEPDGQDPDRAVGTDERAITMVDMTAACVAQHDDPDLRADVRPIGAIPAHWIRCVDPSGDIVGGLDLHDYCAATHPGTLSYNPRRDAPRAWERWECR